MQPGSDRPQRVLAAAVALAVPALASCDRPEPLLICHNSNCAAPVDLSRDNTLPALRESLPQTLDGRPVIDGIEIDSVWDAASGRCVFAHEPPGIGESPPDVEQATREVVAHLEQPGEVSWNGERFLVKLEMKGRVARDGRRHNAEERLLHADCALAQLALLDDASARTGRALDVIFNSGAPALLDALRTRSAWPPVLTSDRVRVRLGASFGAPPPFGFDSRPLGGFSDVDIAVFHPSWITQAAFHSYVSLGVDLDLWMFSATNEAFSAVVRLEPTYVTTGEVLLFRRWLER